jgi:hypothetical protein
VRDETWPLAPEARPRTSREPLSLDEASPQIRIRAPLDDEAAARLLEGEHQFRGVRLGAGPISFADDSAC